MRLAQRARSETENNRQWKQKWVTHANVKDGEIWAYFCEESKSIKCKICQLYGKITALSTAEGTGTQRIRRATLEEHTINLDHQLALELWHTSRARLIRRVPACAFVCAALMRLPPAPVFRPALALAQLLSCPVLLAGQLEKERNAAFSTAISKEKGSILVLVRNALWLGTEMVAANKSVSLANHVMAIKGGGVSTTYRTDMMCAEMQSCIASVIRKRRLQQVAQSPFFGVTIDEGTASGGSTS